MKGINRNFLINTVVAVIYNGLAAGLVLYDQERAYYYTAALFLIAGFHLFYLFFFALRKIRKLAQVGFTGFSILSVLLVHVIFWLLFINLP